MKKFLIITATILGFTMPFIVFGAIAFDATSQGGLVGTTASVSHVTTSTANTILITGIVNFARSSDSVASITYNGVPMIRANWANTGGGVANGPVAAFFYYLMNPASGTHNVVATDTNSDDGAFGVSNVTYTGVGGVDATATTLTLNGGGTNSVTVTPNFDNSWVIGVEVTPNIESAGSNTTNRLSRGNGPVITESNSNPVSPAAMTTMNETVGSPSDQIFLGFDLKPFTSGGGTTITRHFLGTGISR